MRRGRVHPLLWVAGGILLVYFINPKPFQRLAVETMSHGVRPSSQPTELGAGRSADTLALMEEAQALNEEAARTPVKDLSEEFKKKVERLLAPEMPYEVRGKVGRFAHVIGKERFRPHILNMITDPNKTMRVQGLFLAFHDPGITPENAPKGLDKDPDAHVRSVWERFVSERTRR